MLLKADIKRFYGLSISSLILCFFVVFNFPGYYALLLPAVIGVCCLFLLSLENILLLIAFCTPLSVEIFIGNAGITLPNEPLMIAFTGIFLLKLLENPDSFKSVWRNPLTFLIAVDFLWLLVTSITSTLPIVSFKYLASHIWFVTTGLLWGIIIFKDLKNIKRFVIAFGLGLSLIVIYTTIRHWQHSFSQKSGTYVMNPFFDDHTVYSAVCSIIFVFAIVMLTKGRKNLNFINRTAFLAISIFSLTGIVFSYSRAAWLSLIGTFLFALILKWKIKFSWIISAIVIIGLIGILFQNQIYQQIRFNKAASGKTLQDDLKSISNVKTDESNVERLNRWESGWRMFKEKPFLGFGAGTYQFQYSSYQRPHQMTSISTTTGDMGSIHSEYFRALIENGIIGLIIFLLIVLWFVKSMMQIIYTSNNPELKLYATAILLGLMTYLIHGTLNNFLNQDKAALLFWAFLGIAGAIYFKNNLTREK